MSDREKRGTDRLVATRYEAHEALEGHRPVALLGEGIAYVACCCDPSKTRPFMWHVVDLLAEQPEETR